MHERRRNSLLTWLVIAGFFLMFVYHISSVLLPFVVGILTAYFLDPAADRLERTGISRTLSTAIITLLFFTSFIIACVLLVPMLVHQAADLFASLPETIATLQIMYGTQIEEWLLNIDPDQSAAIRTAIGNAAGNFLNMTGALVAGVFQSGMAVVNLFSLLLITPLVAFYLLRDWDRITTHIDGLLPRQHADTIRTQMDTIDATLAGFIRGQLNVCLLVGTYYAVMLSFVGLPFGLILGLCTGILLILPYIGFLFMFIISLTLAFMHFGIGTEFMLVLAVFLSGQVLEGYWLTPKLVGESVGLHPLWIIFGMLAGGALFGLTGVLIAIPATAIIGVLTRFALERYRQSALYHGG
jgi:predicted PurR-regulated permease PerM